MPNALNGAVGPISHIDGRAMLYFGGTSYYCLHSHPQVIQAAQTALGTEGMGPATSRSTVGETPSLNALEQAAAKFFGTEDAVTIASGYLTNAAALAALESKFDYILIDEHAHYSLDHAARLTGKQVTSFSHCNPQDVKQKLKSAMRPLILSDGVFPVTGAMPPLADYLEAITPHDGLIWLDEAHSFGVLGPTGKGAIEQQSIQSARVYSGGTLAKAFGGFGGIIPCNLSLGASLRTSPILNGASAPPAPAIAAALQGIRIVQADHHMRQRLHSNAEFLKSGLIELGIEITESPAPFASWQVGTTETMRKIHQALLDDGIYVQFIEHYAGVSENGLLRAVVFSEHSTDQISQLLNALKRYI